MAGFRAAFFDFDGVLITSEPTWWLVIEEVLGKRDLIPAGGIERVDGLRLDQVIGRLVPGDQALARAVEEEVRRLATPRIAQLPLTDGAVEAVHELAAAGVVLGVVSSSATALLDAVLEANEVRQFFCVVIGGNEVKVGKPDPDGYRRAARQAMVPARQCCAVEDSSAGIEAAAAAGMHVIQFALAEIAGKGRHPRAQACVAAFAAVTDIALGRS